MTVQSDGFRVDGAPTLLAAAEFHYWRHNEIFWPKILDLLVQLGANAVSTFICWDFHELKPGAYDFTGKTNGSRDLVGFLDACLERELLVLARPGPIIETEWVTRGPPPDVCQLDRHDPHFRARASEWIGAVGRALSAHQATRGGPVALVCVDNELYYPWCTDPLDSRVAGSVYVPYKEELVTAAYRAWLRDQFDDVGSLNRLWETRFSSFEEIAPPVYGPAVNDEELLASFRFINDQCTEYIDWAAREYRRAGIDVPLYANQKQMLAYLDWPRIGQTLATTGMNLYTSDLMPNERLMPVSWTCRLQAARHSFAWSAEFQAGWMNTDPNNVWIGPEHGSFLGLVGLALGLRSMAFYMLVERDDWFGSPINSVAKVRPDRYVQYQRLIHCLRRTSPGDEQLADIGLVWTIEDHQLHLGRGSGSWADLFKAWVNFDEPKEASAWWSAFRLLHDEDVDFRLFDPSLEHAPPRILIWAGGLGLSEHAWVGLSAAIRSGTNLVALTRFPRYLFGGVRARESLQEVERQARERGQLISCDPRTLLSVLEGTGIVLRYAATGGNGLLSVAYQNSKTRRLFVINNRPSQADPVHVQLHQSSFPAEGEMFDLWREVGVPYSRGVLDVVLEPKSARVFQLNVPD